MLVVVVAASCKSEPADYPVGGGGVHGGGGTSLLDAPTDGAGSGSAIVRACVLTSSRDLTSCAATGAGDLTVKLGSATATTADDGSFTIAAPTGTNVEWDVTGGTVVESVTPYAGQAKISVMSTTMFADLRGANAVQPVAGYGDLLVRVVRSGAAVPGEVVTSVPVNDPYGTFYDGLTDQAWTQSATGAFGTAYLPSIPAGTTSVRISAGGTLQATISAIPITDGGMTFIVAEVP